MKFFLGFFLLATLAFAGPRLLVLSGTVTNTTGDVSAPARLELSIDGENVSARLVTFPPLTGTGALTGRLLDGWCELTGQLDGGFALKFFGVLNAHDFRGTYTATPENGGMQYGRFVFAPAATNPPSAAAPPQG